MAGKIIADTLETGAGAEISTSYVVNGSAKAWAHYNADGIAAISNSLNTSSITDNGTGDMTISHGSSLNDANYSATCTSRFGLNENAYVSAIKRYATSSTRTIHNNSSQDVLYANGRVDHTDIGLVLHGDLA